ncbi:hypothetical protein GE061_008517 [Apolygus lucorum]|uniref:Translocator protein n=1 Tax=Apolygus lucorum TaxID=248454 RepID=A0A8S9WKN4_APOLU|nr:hypothetical protein GE061_008517 [Apolygus lucorum]
MITNLICGNAPTVDHYLYDAETIQYRVRYRRNLAFIRASPVFLLVPTHVTSTREQCSNSVEMITKHTLLLSALVLLPNIGGWVGAFTFDLDWYNSLHKAPITPPGWLFAPMWTVLYCLMGVASFLVVIKDGQNAFAPFVIYLIQLGLNWAWTPIFFHYHLLIWGLVEICITDVLVVLTIVVFWRVRPLAAVLLFPYITWLGIATYLTAYIYLNN